MNQYKGFSLIELLGSLIMGLIIISLSVSLYLQFKKTTFTQNELSDIQESGRFAVHILYSTLSQAGFIGNQRLTEEFFIVNEGVSSNKAISYGNHIVIFQNSKLPSWMNINPKNNSDVILIKYIDSFLNRMLFLEDNRLKVKLDPKFKQGDDIMISDSSKGILAHINSVYFNEDYQYLFLSQNIKEKFSDDAQVGKLKTAIFFIGKTNRKDRFGNEIYSLYLLNESNRKQELVPNIVSFKINCLTKIKNKLKFENFKDINDLSKLIGVKIDLLLKAENIYQDFEIIIPFKEHLS